ncbi:MAG: UvrD-helicase domain-containing protein [Pirellulales bacterium]|nr:UvrD-helicase domain-containing protein [Pirellulales bacterium]
MAQLNEAQLEAVRTLRGPLLVLAGAGTGKTSVVTHRIAALIRHGARPGAILAVTFTNKAASEMQSRAAALLGRQQKEKPQISTFHSLCVRILRRHITRLGYPAQFTIYDRGDQESAARRALREIRVSGDMLKPSDLLASISTWKMKSVQPATAAELATTDKEHLAASAYRRYQQALKASGAVDFDDLLLLSEGLLARHADVRGEEAARFSHLLIDEYQDTNQSQYQIVKALAREHRNLCVVGDDDQSIYGWRGAEVTHILNFQRDWPESKVVRLEQNYRCTSPILEMANRLIAFNRQRHKKVLRSDKPGEAPRILQAADEVMEAKNVVEEVRIRLETPGVEPRDFAILFRTNEQPRLFETELRRVKLPYVLIGGSSFYDRKEVRDILAYVKLLAQPKDEAALLRILNTPARGIGPSTAKLLVETAISQGKPAWEILCDPKALGRVTEATAAGMRQLVELVERYRRRAQHGSLVDTLKSLIHEIGYQDELARLYPTSEEQQTRWTAVEEVVNALANYEKQTSQPSLDGFVADLLLADRDQDDEKEKQLKRNAVVLMTLHSAKGLEFNEVYLVGMEEGLLPHRRAVEMEGDAIDEERRLCYVGVTRARERLTLTLALARNKWGKSRPTVPSRFLFEITGRADNPHARKGARPQPTASRPASGQGRSKPPRRGSAK